MDLRVLEYFMTVAEEENVTRAAELLHISQPTLSRQMMQLEDEFGVELLVRGNKSVALTPEGKILKERAKEILGLYDKTKAEMKSESSRIEGDIYIGVQEMQVFQALAQRISEFRQMYPDVHFVVTSENYNSLTERVSKGLLDMGILYGPIQEEQYGSFPMSRATQRWGVFVPRNHILANKHSVTEDDLINETLICPQRHVENGRFKTWFERYDEFDIGVTYNLLSYALIMVQEEVGIAIGIENDLQKVHGTKFIPFKPEIYDKERLLVWNKNRPFSKPARVFLDYVRTHRSYRN